EDQTMDRNERVPAVQLCLGWPRAAVQSGRIADFEGRFQSIGLPWRLARSSRRRSVFIANAASAPSAAATTTHWTARDASPATYSPARSVVSYGPVRTVPLSFISQPRPTASWDCWA